MLTRTNQEDRSDGAVAQVTAVEPAKSQEIIDPSPTLVLPTALLS